MNVSLFGLNSARLTLGRLNSTSRVEWTKLKLARGPRTNLKHDIKTFGSSDLNICRAEALQKHFYWLWGEQAFKQSRCGGFRSLGQGHRRNESRIRRKRCKKMLFATVANAQQHWIVQQLIVCLVQFMFSSKPEPDMPDLFRTSVTWGQHLVPKLCTAPALGLKGMSWVKSYDIIRPPCIYQTKRHV